MIRGTLYRKELRFGWPNWAIWTAILVGLTVVLGAVFPMLQNMSGLTDFMIENMPEELLNAMGMNVDTWNSILGYYSTYYGIYIVLLCGIYITTTSISIHMNEERDKTAEFLFTKPISRKSIFYTKLLAVFTFSIGILIIQSVTAYICFETFGKGEYVMKDFLIMTAHGWALLIFFLCFGILLSTLASKRINFMGLVVGLLFGGYLVNALSQMTGQLKWLGYIAPHYYADFNAMNPGYELNPKDIAILLSCAAFFIAFAYYRFLRKEIDG